MQLLVLFLHSTEVQSGPNSKKRGVSSVLGANGRWRWYVAPAGDVPEQTFSLDEGKRSVRRCPQKLCIRRGCAVPPLPPDTQS